jgi:hypothetical protein
VLSSAIAGGNIAIGIPFRLGDEVRKRQGSDESGRGVGMDMDAC